MKIGKLLIIKYEKRRKKKIQLPSNVEESSRARSGGPILDDDMTDGISEGRCCFGAGGIASDSL